MIDSGNDSPITYFQIGSGNCSFIDHFCISQCLLSCVKRSYILDNGDNTSDHLPLCLVLNLNVSETKLAPSSMPPTKRLRWDKADLNAYYYGTYNCLKDRPYCVWKKIL